MRMMCLHMSLKCWLAYLIRSVCNVAEAMTGNQRICIGQDALTLEKRGADVLQEVLWDDSNTNEEPLLAAAPATPDV